MPGKLVYNQNFQDRTDIKLYSMIAKGSLVGLSVQKVMLNSTIVPRYYLPREHYFLNRMSLILLIETDFAYGSREKERTKNIISLWK